MLDRGSQLAQRATRNPKAETRRPKGIRTAKSETGRGSPHADRPTEGHPHHALRVKSAAHASTLAISDFGFRPSFGFRISGFGFDPAICSTSTTRSKQGPHYGPRSEEHT